MPDPMKTVPPPSGMSASVLQSLGLWLPDIYGKLRQYYQNVIQPSPLFQATKNVATHGPFVGGAKTLSQNPQVANQLYTDITTNVPLAAEHFATWMMPAGIESKSAAALLPILKAYHGTTKSILGPMTIGRGGDYEAVYFTKSPSQANEWATGIGRYKGETGPSNVYSAELALRNPASYADVQAAKKSLGNNWTRESLTRELKSRGFDGVIDDTYKGNEIAVFDPKNVQNVRKVE